MANFSLKYSDQVVATASFVDAAGNPALVTGVTAVSDNTVVATVSLPAETGPVASVAVVVTAVGPLGTANVTVTGTNPDGTTVTGTQEISVVAGDATAVTIVMGTPSAVAAPVVPEVAPEAPTA